MAVPVTRTLAEQLAGVGDPERGLAIAYAPRAAREAIALLWRFDEMLAGVVRSTTEPLIGQMRLTWWHEAIAALETGPTPAEPLLQDIAAILPAQGLAPAALLPLIDGWELLIDPLPFDAAQLAGYAEGRGAALFDLAARALGGTADEAVRAAGRGWALVDLAFHCTDRRTAEAALAAARDALAARPRRWPSGLRALGMLTVLAARDVRAGLDGDRRAGSPGRLARALAHRITGY